MTDALITADANRRMFDTIARRYDLTNRILSFGLDRHWRKKAIQALVPADDKLYLDVGCGTGDVMIELLRQAPAARVWGIDPADKMLEVARYKLNEIQSLDRTDLLNADACNLPFDDGIFGGIISAFCFRNITDRRQALAEAKRTLSSGGRLVLLELTITERSWLAPFYKLHSRGIVPFVGRLVGNREAYQYLSDSIYDFSCNVDVEEMMRNAGFSHVEKMPLSGGIVTIFVGQRL